MSSRKAKFLSMAAVAGAVAFVSASAQAQYVTRPYHRAYPYHARAQGLYDAQAYVGVGTVLPPTIVGGGFGQIFYDPYGNLPAVYGCCWTTNNENVGLAGAAAEGGHP